MNKVLLTGASGFLGSHIAEELVKLNFYVIALKRTSSDIGRCESFKEKIKWVNCDYLSQAEAEIIECRPEILIHAAWNGVKASDRFSWIEQEKNLSYLITLLKIAKKAGISKIISLGSQAEYGSFEGEVDESYPCNPNNAYGATKLCSYILLKTFSEQNNLSWLWIRLFSVFGPREGNNWLIPATINNLLDKKEMTLTACEQKYDYLFVKDFVSGIISTIRCSEDKSGIYNLASGNSIKLKEILAFLEEHLSPDKKLLKIGVLPYRPGQVMNMQGNSDLFNKSFSFKPLYNIYDGLDETIKYYTNERINASK